MKKLHQRQAGGRNHVYGCKYENISCLGCCEKKKKQWAKFNNTNILCCVIKFQRSETNKGLVQWAGVSYSYLWHQFLQLPASVQGFWAFPWFSKAQTLIKKYKKEKMQISQ